MRQSIQAFILWAALLVAGALPAHATSVPFTNFQGNWAPSSSYAVGAVVTYQGSTYICLQANKNTSPIGHAFKWEQLPNLPAILTITTTSSVSNLGGYPGTLILETVAVPTSGFYHFNATALVTVNLNDSGVYCYTSFSGRGASSDGTLGGLSNPFSGVTLQGQAAVVDYWGIPPGDSAQLYCYSELGESSSSVDDAALSVSLGTDPATGVGAGSAADSDIVSNNRAEVRPQVRALKQK